MRLKSFYAKNISDAMKMVRDTLGEDAIIVATREEARGKAVSVTAAVDNDSYLEHKDMNNRIERFLEEVEAGDAKGTPPDKEHIHIPPSSSPNNQDQKTSAYLPQERRDSYFQHALPDETTTSSTSSATRQPAAGFTGEEENQVFDILADLMIRHAASAEVTDEILSCASVMGELDARQTLITAFDHLYSFTPLPSGKTSRALVLAGPPGAGKTLAIAKIATRAAMDGLRTEIITTDTVRAGGVEQLRAFTDILGLSLHRAETPAQLAELVERATASPVKKGKKDSDNIYQILIDTAGVNPFNPADMHHLAKLLSAAKAEAALVLPAGSDAEECGEMARTFSAIGTRFLLPSRLDIGRRYGGILTAAHQGRLHITDGSHTAKVADGLIRLTAETLAAILLPAGRQRSDRRTASGSNLSYQSSSLAPQQRGSAESPSNADRHRSSDDRTSGTTRSAPHVNTDARRDGHADMPDTSLHHQNKPRQTKAG